MEENKNSNFKTVAIIALLSLLGLNIYQYMDGSSKSTTIDTQSAQLVESKKLSDDLDVQFKQAVADLDAQKTTNTELNQLIETQKADLEKQRSQISNLITIKKDYGSAKAQLAKLKDQVNVYLGEITELKKKNEELTASNTQLSKENQDLNTEVVTARSANQDLTAQKKAIEDEKSRIEEERKNLKKKVTKASAIAVSDIVVTGFKVRESGKESKKRNAENIDRLKICFKLLKNSVTEAGTETFHFRILNPQGEIIAVEDQGSGVVVNNDTNDQMRYTCAKEISYQNQEVSDCTVWNKNNPFSPGVYEVEVYNKGYLVGKGNFKLK
jgi:DNA repair exonuclease SbcCD ATPase subunit